MPLAKKQKPGEPFDPLAQMTTTPGASAQARWNRGRRAERLERARRMAIHLGLTATGGLPEDETGHNLSPKQRDERDDRLRTGFEEITPEALKALESLIDRYGLPLEELDTRIAAFVLRRVLLEYRNMAYLQRDQRQGMFTPQELVELMRVLHVNQHQLADLLAGQASPQKRYQTYVMIQRWVHGINKPTGVTALKANRMIELHVRRKTRGGMKPEGSREPDEELSDKPATVERRTRWRKRRAGEGEMDIPLSTAAQQARKAREESDATER
jgi:succinate dehydrogenase flavin-adding protein (antitoxin of CptAB toxin-antitoxin module)